MSGKYLSPIKWVGGSAIIVFVIGMLWWKVLKDALFDEAGQNGVLVNAIPFVATFIAILLLFILVIVLLAKRFNGKLPRRLYSSVEITVVGGIGVSVLMLFQPFQLVKQQLGWIPGEILWMVTSIVILMAVRSIRGLARGVSRMIDIAVLALITMIGIAIIDIIGEGLGLPAYLLGGLAVIAVLAAIFSGEKLPILDDYARNEHGIIAVIVFVLALFFSLVVREADWVPADVSFIKSIQDEVIKWMDRWQLIGFEFGFILLMFCTLFYILWSHIVPGSKSIETSLPPLQTRHHIIGVIVGLMMLVIVTGGLASLNQPKEPYGMRQRQFDTLSDEQKAEMADEANDDFNYIEVPFLIFLGLFPASIVYYVSREASLALESDGSAPSMPQAESVAT